MSTGTRQIHLVARPHGLPKDTDFKLVETLLPGLEPRQVLVRNIVMSVDPYMRGRMSDTQSYAEPWRLDAPAQGGALGEVMQSAIAHIRPGTLVLHDAGWRDHALLSEHEFGVLRVSAGMPLSYYLGVLGMPGLTAYTGLFRIARLRPGDTVFVSGAAGAVGSLVGQLAKLHGAKRVIGSAGSAEKVRFLLNDLGFDEAFNYRDGAVKKLLADAAPEGIDLFFDNVGGEHLETAIDSFNINGRVAVCGAISGCNTTESSPGPRNLVQLIRKRLMVHGFIVYDHEDLRPEFEAVVAPAIRASAIDVRETRFYGLENAAAAFIGMLRGENIGKTVVYLDDRPAWTAESMRKALQTGRAL